MNGALFYKVTFLSLCLISFPTLSETKKFTILHTNDIESVYDPIEKVWDNKVEHIGGIYKLSTLMENKRTEITAKGGTVFTFDSGDIFTGALSKASKGKLSFDLYNEMGFDAMAVGNHEFDYGQQAFIESKRRANFHVLNSNIIYEGTNINFAQPYAIIERDGIRIGVIGVMGVDAFLNTMSRSAREGLDYLDPLETVNKYIDILKNDVDMIIILTHQNRTAPMQTNKENDKNVLRGYHEDYAMAGVLKNVGAILGGHSDNGLREPVIHPQTGIPISMTFGQGMHLSVLNFEKDENGNVTYINGHLEEVISDNLESNEKMVALIEKERAKYPKLAKVVGRSDSFAYRQYFSESNIGNLIADSRRIYTNADVGIIHSGGIRADIPKGKVTYEVLNNVLPFDGNLQIVTLTGKQVKSLLHYALKVRYGQMQISGMEIIYDSSKPEDKRLISATIGGKTIKDEEKYTFSVDKFLALGGDGYTIFREGTSVDSGVSSVETLVHYYQDHDVIKVPKLGRQIDISKNNEKS